MHRNVWLLFRDPSTAIPYYNYLWEITIGKKVKSHLNKAQSHHSRQAPEEDWIEFRDRSFENQIKTWTLFFRRWKDLDDRNISLYVPYEDLIHEERGPGLLKEMIDQLREANHSIPADIDVQCIWNRHVNEGTSVKRTKALGTGHQYRRLREQLLEAQKEVTAKRPLVLLQSYMELIEAELQGTLADSIRRVEWKTWSI